MSIPIQTSAKWMATGLCFCLVSSNLMMKKSGDYRIGFGGLSQHDAA